MLKAKKKKAYEKRGNIAFSRLFINAGKKQNLNAARLLGLINEHAKGRM